MKYTLLTALLTIIILLFASACSLVATPTPTPAVDTPVPTPAPADKLNARLDELPSYRAWLVLQFSGEDVNGSPTTARFIAVEERSQLDASLHLLARSDLQNERPGSVDIYRFSGQTYLVSSELVGQEGCQRVDADQLSRQNELAPHPADLFTAIYRGELLSVDDSIGTLSAVRYRLAGADLKLGQSKNIQGTLWLAHDGQTVLRFTGSAEGALSLGAGATYGRVEWEYLLTDINAVQPTLPPDCQAIAENTFPLPSNATRLERSGNILRFDTTLAPREVIDFYRSELASRGYDIQIDSGGGAAYNLSGIKAGKRLQIAITASKDSALVEISLP
jgi:hypothetical protein